MKTRNFRVLAVLTWLTLLLVWRVGRLIPGAEPLAGSGPQVGQKFSGGDDIPGPNESEIQKFLLAKGYEKWPHAPAHLSGQSVRGVNYTVHRHIEVFYSPKVKDWIDATPPKRRDALDGPAMIVALEWSPQTNKQGERTLERIACMIRATQVPPADRPYDGWYWSTTELKTKTTHGQFGDSRCMSCHSAADNESFVFLSRDGSLDEQSTKVKNWLPGELEMPPPRTFSDRTFSDRLKLPLGSPNTEFVKYFNIQRLMAANPNDLQLTFPDKKFDHVYQRPHFPDGANPHKQQFVTSDQCMTCHNASVLLSNSRPNMWYPEPYPEQSLVDGARDPLATIPRNFSPYGEWAASLNGLGARDPVWHAQVEFERELRGEKLADFTTATCFTCHGPMVGRQLTIDKAETFSIEMFYATPEVGAEKKHPRAQGEHGSPAYAKYGALARDGISCAVCHQISADGLGEDPTFDVDNPTAHLNPNQLNTYTANFKVESDDDKAAFWGPYEEGRLTEGKVASLPMDKTFGQRARFGPLNAKDRPQIHESKLCGSCHTVIVPALPVGYRLPVRVNNPFVDPAVKMSFEQVTYFEWRNSRFENEIRSDNATTMTCQVCHMAAHHTNPQYGNFAERIVNVESNQFPPAAGRAPDSSITYTKKDPIFRHVLLGINYFVFEMYEQFHQKLVGQPFTVSDPNDPSKTRRVDRIVNDPGVPADTVHPFVNARNWIENHAKNITAEVRITDFVVLDDAIEFEVEVTNFAGHKFPTGAGFRRAFLCFELLGNDDTKLWASGRVNSIGVILKGITEEALASEHPLDADRQFDLEKSHYPELSQPHHQIVDDEGKVQIYETRALDSDDKLQTTVLGIFNEYKNNRIPPRGWKTIYQRDTPTRNIYAMNHALVGRPAQQPPGVRLHPHEGVIVSEHAFKHPVSASGFEVVYDDDYWHPVYSQRGQDHIRYRIPKKRAEDWKKARVQLYYQTIPPYYLRDRFQTGVPPKEQFPSERIPDIKRMAFMASHLNLAGSPGENWSLKVGEAAELVKPDGAPPKPQRRLTSREFWNRMRKHYVYVDLPQNAPDSELDEPAASTGSPPQKEPTK